MRFLLLGLAFAALVGACTAQSDLPQTGTFFTVKAPNILACDTHDAEVKAMESARKSDTAALDGLLLRNGGNCMQLPVGAQFVVSEVDPTNRLVGVRLADTPGGGSLWTLANLVTASPTPSAPN